MAEQRDTVVEAEREHHDRVAPEYDRFFVDTLHYRLLHGEVVAGVARHVRPEDGPVVDLGAGTGAIAVPLFDRGYDVVAMDISPGMLARLSAKRPAMRTRLGDVGSRLPFEDASVGGVLINEVLHHLSTQRQEAALREAWRILRMGGTLCLCEPQLLPKGFDWIRRIARKRLNPRGAHTPGETPIDPERVRRLVEGCGFSILEAATTFFLPFSPEWRPAQWFIKAFWRVPGRIPLIRRLGGSFRLCARKVPATRQSLPASGV